jgi:hypothetical protein
MIPHAHKKFVDYAITRLEMDDRFLGLAAGGSWDTDRMDEYSDLDLFLICDPGRSTSVMADRERVCMDLGPCLASFRKELGNEPDIFVCLYDDPPLKVDLHILSLDDFQKRGENPVVVWERNGAVTKVIEGTKPQAESHDLQWVEDRFWTWIFRGAQLLGRGEIFAVHTTLAVVRDQALGPLETARAGKFSPCGVRRIERTAKPDSLVELRATIATYDARDCERALKAAAKMYVGLRESLDPGDLRRNRRAEMASLRYLHEVSGKL